MPSKRRNNGRNKKNKGHADTVRCTNCGRVVSKDKAIKRFQQRNMVDASSKRDIQENYAYAQADFQMPKIYVKQAYCVSCAIHYLTFITQKYDWDFSLSLCCDNYKIHARIVRNRRVEDRRNRYTTKLRQHVRPEAQTGNASLPLSQLPRI